LNIGDAFDGTEDSALLSHGLLTPSDSLFREPTLWYIHGNLQRYSVASMECLMEVLCSTHQQYSYHNNQTWLVTHYDNSAAILHQ